jgi:hypothetical protein
LVASGEERPSDALGGASLPIVRRLLCFLFFLLLVNDGQAKSGAYDAMYGNYFWTPTLWSQPVLFDPVLKVRPFDILVAVALFVGLGSRSGKAPLVQPLKKAMLLAVATTILCFMLGVARGGDARAASWQIYLVLATILASFAISANFRTPEHYYLLGKVYVLAGLYRTFMCLLFYFGWWRHLAPEDAPPYLTTHEDSVLWVATIMLLLTNAVEVRSRRAVAIALAAIPLLMLAIQVNNRRIAWVSLAAALFTFYALLRSSRVKKRITRAMLMSLPLVGAYVVIGWGREGRLFRPLAALATVSTVEDASTRARNCENLGLIATANANGWVLSSGWGHKYIELTNKYSIASAFELWQYVPHNSILGIFAFTGTFGFIGFWLRVPIAVYLHARTARLAPRGVERGIGLAAVATTVVCCNQMYGDMGVFSGTTMYSLAAVLAAAMRVPIEAGTWPDSARKVPAPTARSG